MSEELVPFARFRSTVEAHLARGLLERAGIPSFIRNEFSPGQVELMVARSSLEEAIQVLQSAQRAGNLGPKEEEEEEHVTRCLICQSSFVVAEEGPLPFRILKALVAALLPVPSAWFKTKKRRCNVCGYRWKDTGGDTHAPSGITVAEQHGDRLRSRRR